MQRRVFLQSHERYTLSVRACARVCGLCAHIFWTSKAEACPRDECVVELLFVRRGPHKHVQRGIAILRAHKQEHE